MSGYTDTLILEANRVNSNQFANNEDETSIWTNVVSTGVKLNVGDKISLHSAYVSDLGAEDSTIEFKGIVVEDEQVFDTIETINFEPTSFNGQVAYAGNAPYLRPTPYEYTEINPKRVVLSNVKDNEANILLSYYKTNNGEFMMNLPIRHHPSTLTETPAGAWTKVRRNENNANCLLSGMGLFVDRKKWYSEDQVIDMSDKYQGLIIDNSRYMIFGHRLTKKNQRSSGDREAIIVKDEPKRFRDLNGYRNYMIKITELLQMEVPIGFNSPSEVSEVITSQLQKNTTIKDKSIPFNDGNNHFFQSNIGPVNETPSNKLFVSATYDSLNITQADYFYGRGDATEQNPRAFGNQVRDYQTGFQYVGIKRPEIYETGVKLKIGVNNQKTTPGPDLFRVDLSPNLQLPKIASDISNNNYLGICPGSLQNQFPLYPATSDPVADPTSRFPDVSITNRAVDESYMRDSINPYFTNFLEENPFGEWNGIPDLPPAYNSYVADGDYATGASIIGLVYNPATQNPVIDPKDLPWWMTTAIETSSFTNQQSILIDYVVTGATYILLVLKKAIPNAIVAGQTINVFTNQLNIPTPTQYSVVNTGMEWTQENLNLLKDFFDSQSRYPELFNVEGNSSNSPYSIRNNKQFNRGVEYNGQEISVDTHRFLHIGSQFNKDTQKELGVGEFLPHFVEPDTPDTLPGPNRILGIDNDPKGIDNTKEGNLGGDVYTSFGSDNIPSIFTEFGTANGTINTKDIDQASKPLFVSYMKEQETNGSGMTKAEFDTTNWWDGRDFDKRPKDNKLSTPRGMWGGFAIKTQSCCCVVPKRTATQPARDWSTIPENNTAETGIEVIKSYNPQSIWGETGGGGFQQDPTHTEFEPGKNIFPTISFICQLPKDYTPNRTLYTRINASGVYDPTAVPVQREIPTLYTIDWYGAFLNQDIGSKAVPTSLALDTRTIKIGYDTHATAYGNAFIGLYNGMANAEGSSYKGEYNTQINEDAELNIRGASSIIISATTSNSDKYLNEVYCGALTPELSFDTTTSRFALSSFHTSEKITAKYNATLSEEADKVIPVPDNLGKDCYRVNKIFDFRNYCPSITPYYDAIGYVIKGTLGETKLIYNNPYCKTGVIFDMSSGIFIEDFSISKVNWNRSFWGICGFNYDDLNVNNTGNINIRVIDGNYGNLSKITTNQDASNFQIGEWFGPLTGVANYKNQYSYPVMTELVDLKKIQTFNPIEVLSNSAKIEATELPSKTLRPYFTIRSDILTDSYFTGGADDPSLMPVIGIIEKNEQYGDFFYGSGQVEFTNTIPRTITQITTQICDPSGKASILSPNSACIYKIVKANNTNLNVAEEVLKANKNNPTIVASIQ